MSLPTWGWPWCLFLFLLPFEQVINQSGIGWAYTLLGLASGAFIALSPEPEAPKASRRTVAIALLLLSVSLSFYGSLDPSGSRQGIVLVGINALIYLLATSKRLRLGQLLLSLRAWGWGAGLAALMTLWAFAHGQWGDDGRATLVLGGLQADPNFLVAGFLVPWGVALFLIERRRTRFEGLALLFTLGITILLTQSRGGLIGVALVSLGTLALRRRWGSLALLASLVIGLGLVLGPSIERFNLANDPTGAGRTMIWEVGVAVGCDHWINGVGLNALPLVTAGAPGLYWDRDAHNTYVQAFAECGVPGLAALLLVLATHLGPARGHPLAPPLRTSMVALAVVGFFLHFLTLKLLWVAWLIAAQADAARLPRPRHRRRKGGRHAAPNRPHPAPGLVR